MLNVITHQGNCKWNCKTPIRMTTVRNQQTDRTEQALARVWRNGTLVTTGGSAPECSSRRSRVSTGPAVPLPDNTSQSWKQRLDEVFAHLCSYNSTAHSSLHVRETRVSTVGWMAEQNAAYLYDRPLLGFKKEGNSDTCCNTDEPWRRAAQWNKSQKNKQISYNSTEKRSLRGASLVA